MVPNLVTATDQGLEGSAVAGLRRVHSHAEEGDPQAELIQSVEQGREEGVEIRRTTLPPCVPVGLEVGPQVVHVERNAGQGSHVCHEVAACTTLGVRYRSNSIAFWLASPIVSLRFRVPLAICAEFTMKTCLSEVRTGGRFRDVYLSVENASTS